MSEVKKPLSVFLSAPFTGISNEDLISNYESNKSKLIKILCKHYGVEVDDIKILCTSTTDGQLFFIDKNDYRHKGLYCVGKCMSELIASCDVVVFGHNWRLSKGCMVEQYAASIYGLDYVDLDQREPYVHTNTLIKRKVL